MIFIFCVLISLYLSVHIFFWDTFNFKFEEHKKKWVLTERRVHGIKTIDDCLFLSFPFLFFIFIVDQIEFQDQEQLIWFITRVFHISKH